MLPHMTRSLAVLFALTLAGAGLAEEDMITDFDYVSPDGHFAMRMTYPKSDPNSDAKVDLVDKQSGKVMVDLGRVADSQLEDAVMVWSADSKRVAYGFRTDAPGARIASGETVAFFWNGASFDKVALPGKLPTPHIQYPNGEPKYVKPYGGTVKPLRWLKSGELELSSDEMMYSPDDDKSYTAVVKFTAAFDSKHNPKVKTVGKSQTKVE